jgi:hypothetical protein
MVHALDRAATVIGCCICSLGKKSRFILRMIQEAQIHSADKMRLYSAEANDTYSDQCALKF